MAAVRGGTVSEGGAGIGEPAVDSPACLQPAGAQFRPVDRSALRRLHGDRFAVHSPGMTETTLFDGGPTFSRIVFGTWRLLDDAIAATPDGTLALLKTALDCGIHTVDTAEIYGGYAVEALLGEALRRDPGVKSRVRLVTKCGIYVPCPAAPDRRVAHYDATADRIVASAEKSLRLLGVETLDLLLVHRPDWFTAAEDTAAGLNRLLKEGKIRAAGVSNYTPSQFSALQSFMDRPLVTNQVEFSLFATAPIFDGTLDQCQERRIQPMAWSPTGGGRLFDSADATALRLKAAAASLTGIPAGTPPDRLAHAWILAHPSRPLSVLGTTKADRIRSAAAAAELSLSREDWYALTEAARGARIP